MSTSRGVQPVIGAVLLIAVVLLLATVVFALVTGFQTEQPAPQAATDVVFYSEFNASTGAATPYITLKQRGGDTIQRENLDPIVTVGGQSYDNLTVEGPDSGPVRAGDELVYNLTNAELCSRPDDQFTVRLVHEPSNKLVASQEVDIQDEVDVNVTGNAVTSEVPFRATVRIVGMAASVAAGGDLKPDTLTARVVVNRPSGTTRLTPWPDNDTDDAITDRFDDNVNRPKMSPPINYSTGTLPANSSVTLEMRSGKPDAWNPGTSTVTRNGNTYDVLEPDGDEGLADTRFWVDSGNPSEGNLILLQDGESVPTYGQAGDHQRSLQDILGPKLDGTGQLSLDQNDVVVLFELTDPSAQPSMAPPPSGGGNPDYNDGVAIIEIEPTPGASTSDPGVLYC